MDITTTDPVWTVKHVAAARYVDLRAACALTRSPGFPQARDAFAADRWTREEVLAWFAALPGRGLEQRMPAVPAPATRPHGCPTAREMRPLPDWPGSSMTMATAAPAGGH